LGGRRRQAIPRALVCCECKIELLIFARTRQNGAPVAGLERTQFCTLLVGLSCRLSDTPDVQLSLRMPVGW
jgi:hypothetical protein